MYYNKDLFDEADLDYPPAAYGEPYADGDPWDMDKVAELAMLLTVDANGNDATSPDFDRDNIVQWGFHQQFNDDARSIGTFFAPGSFVAEDGTAQIPEHWIEAWQWYNDLVTAGAAPNQSETNSDVLGGGNAFNTGNVAMANTHLWYTCCVRDENNVGKEFWDLAVMPEYNGDGDVEAARRHVPHPLVDGEPGCRLRGAHVPPLDAPALLDTYGALPAREDLREPFFARSRRRCSHRASTGTPPSPGWSGRTCRATSRTCPTSSRPRS